jgi:cytidyltransferase-like protein
MEKSNWDKIVHVASSLVPKVNQYSMFIGRWQPLHLGHQALFQQALNEGKNLFICIRDGEVNEKNPFTSEDVKRNIEDVYALLVNSGIMKVMIIPDICSVEFGRGVGYDIIEHIPPTEISDVSATKIREEMRKDGKL